MTGAGTKRNETTLIAAVVVVIIVAVAVAAVLSRRDHSSKGTATQAGLLDDTVLSGTDFWTYTGTGWMVGVDPVPGRPPRYGGSDHYSGSAGDFVTLTFVGTQAQIIGARDPEYGQIGVSVDAGTETVVDDYSPARAEPVVLVSTATLRSGRYTVKLRITGNKNAASTSTYMSVDAARVTPAPLGPPVVSSFPGLS